MNCFILLFKGCFDKCNLWMVERTGQHQSYLRENIGRVSVGQIFSSNKRFTTAIQVERSHYKFDLSSSSRIAYERSLQEAIVW